MGIYTIPVAYSIWFVGLFNKFTKAKYYIAQSWDDTLDVGCEIKGNVD